MVTELNKNPLGHLLDKDELCSYRLKMHLLHSTKIVSRCRKLESNMYLNSSVAILLFSKSTSSMLPCDHSNTSRFKYKVNLSSDIRMTNPTLSLSGFQG